MVGSQTLSYWSPESHIRPLAVKYSNVLFIAARIRVKDIPPNLTIKRQLFQENGHFLVKLAILSRSRRIVFRNISALFFHLQFCTYIANIYVPTVDCCPLTLLTNDELLLQGHHDDGCEGPVPRGHGGADAQVHPFTRGARAPRRACRGDRPPGPGGQVPLRTIQVGSVVQDFLVNST
jgi:hypothetical protein